MVWYGMVWYGMVWYGMVWYGMDFLTLKCILNYIYFSCVLYLIYIFIFNLNSQKINKNKLIPTY